MNRFFALIAVVSALCASEVNALDAGSDEFVRTELIEVIHVEPIECNFFRLAANRSVEIQWIEEFEDLWNAKPLEPLHEDPPGSNRYPGEVLTTPESVDEHRLKRAYGTELTAYNRAVDRLDSAYRRDSKRLMKLSTGALWGWNGHSISIYGYVLKSTPVVGDLVFVSSVQGSCVYKGDDQVKFTRNSRKRDCKGDQVVTAPFGEFTVGKYCLPTQKVKRGAPRYARRFQLIDPKIIVQRRPTCDQYFSVYAEKNPDAHRSVVNVVTSVKRARERDKPSSWTPSDWKGVPVVSRTGWRPVPCTVTQSAEGKVVISATSEINRGGFLRARIFSNDADEKPARQLEVSHPFGEVIPLPGAQSSGGKVTTHQWSVGVCDSTDSQIKPCIQLELPRQPYGVSAELECLMVSVEKP